MKKIAEVKMTKVILTKNFKCQTSKNYDFYKGIVYYRFNRFNWCVESKMNGLIKLSLEIAQELENFYKNL